MIEEESNWNNEEYKVYGAKYSRKYLMFSKEVLNDRVLLLFKKYKVNTEDAGKLTALISLLAAKEVGERGLLKGGFRR
jgi:hypothetical protein